MSYLTVHKDVGSIIKISLQSLLIFLLATDCFKTEGKVSLRSGLLETKNYKEVFISRVLQVSVHDDLDGHFIWGNNPVISHTNAKNLEFL